MSVGSQAGAPDRQAAGDRPAALPPSLIRLFTVLLGKSWSAYPAMAAILGIGLATHLGATINHDIGWYLIAGERFLDGERLYDEVFVEVNAPLALFQVLPAVVVARLTGWFAVDVFVAYVYLLIGLSLFATQLVLRRDPSLPRAFRNGLLLTAALALTFCTADQFGQREHLLMALVLPYTALIALRRSGRSLPWLWAAGLGVAAALGFAVKPHYLLVPFAFEIYRLALARNWRAVLRPETVALGLTVAIYGAAVILLTPDYLGRVVPYALEVYNQAYRNPLWMLLVRVETLFLPLGCLAQLTTRRQQRHGAFGDLFMIASACFFLVYLIQMKGWFYHLYPASVCLMLGYAALFLDGLSRLGSQGASPADRPPTDRQPTDRGPSRDILLSALAVVVLLAVVDAGKGTYRNRFMDALLPHVARHAAGGSIALLGSNVWPGFPLANYGDVGWSSRFSTLWLLPGLIQERNNRDAAPSDRLDEIERYLRDSVTADLVAVPPRLVIVDRREKKSYFAETDFDYLEYFLQDPRFARLWADYEWVGEAFDFDLYRRSCASACD